MKKFRLASLLLLAPLALLPACARNVPTLSFTANWYQNTALGGNIENTYEALEYDVTFESTPANGFSVSYTDGTYKTVLQNKMIALENGQQHGYVYTTEFNIKVRYALNGQESAVFEDYVRTSVEFLPVTERLRPVRSSREVLSHSPYGDRPATLEDAFGEYRFSYVSEYNDATSVAKTVYTDLKTQAVSEREYEIKGEETFLDNEQILFALRGLSMTSTANFHSINYVTGGVQSVTFAAAPTETQETGLSFELNGEPFSGDVAAYSMELSYGGTNSGQRQTLVYAKTVDPAANTFRNVLLRMETTTLSSLGKLRYTLSKATFAEK